MIHEILTTNINSKIILINGQKLQVFEDGRVERWFKGRYFRLVKHTGNTNNGYNVIDCNRKGYMRHRIIGFAFLGLDIDDLTLQIDHKNGNKLNNNVSNLRIVSNQENQWNRTTAKGYSWKTQHQKYRAYIAVNLQQVHLGYYDTELEAHNAYLEAKTKLHIIPER